MVKGHFHICCKASVTAIIVASILNAALVVVMREVVAAIHGPIGGIAIGIFTRSYGQKLIKINQ